MKYKGFKPIEWRTMKIKSFVKYNLIIAGAFFILALLLEWTFWDHNQMSKKIPIAIPLGLLIIAFLILLSVTNKEKDLLSSTLKGWSIAAISILVLLVLVGVSFLLSEKIYMHLRTGLFVMLIFSIQYLMIAFIGKKYSIDESDNIRELISKNPGMEKWISKYALKRYEDRLGEEKR